MPFLLIRHGSVDYDAHPAKFRGHGVDLVPLTPAGITEAEQLASLLPPVDLIVSSPMTRALQTAHILSRPTGVGVVVELDLHEWVPDMTQQWSGPQVPRAADAEQRRLGGEWPPGAQRDWEPLSAVRKRVVDAFERYRSPSLIAVVTHSVVIEALTGRAATPPCGFVSYEPPAAV